MSELIHKRGITVADILLKRDVESSKHGWRGSLSTHHSCVFLWLKGTSAEKQFQLQSILNDAL